MMCFEMCFDNKKIKKPFLCNLGCSTKMAMATGALAIYGLTATGMGSLMVFSPKTIAKSWGVPGAETLDFKEPL